MIEMPDMIRDLCRILYFSHLTKLCSIVVECVAALAVDDALQTHLYQAGVLFHLIVFLFNYDFTLEEGGVERDEDTNKQEIANRLAKLSLVALSRLGGYGSDTPKNDAVNLSLRALLTPYLVTQLQKTDSVQVLKILNSNTESPYLIWDNSTRAELNEYLDRQQKEKIRSGECDPTYGSEFKFSAHSSELIVGGIFVRVYNEQPTFPLEEPKLFTLELLDFLCSQAQYLYSLMSLQSSGVKTETNQTRLRNVQMALEALANVVKTNPGVEMQFIGHFKLLFSLLRLDDCPQVQALAINVIAAVTGSQFCVNDIAASDVLVYLLLVLHSFRNSTSQITVLETFLPLMSNGNLVKDAMTKGAVIYLLDLFCNGAHSTVRELSGGLMAKMTQDKLIGPKLRITLTKFLPPLFLDAMKDSPETAVHMFEGTQENPELIWNDDSRDHLCAIVKKLANEHYKIQKDDPEVQWKAPNENVMSIPENQETIVGGVYLRLFIQNPTWVLRRPKEFLTELLDQLNALMAKDNINEEILETLTQALICLLVAQPSLLDQIPALGHIPRLLQVMSRPQDSIAGACLRILRQMSNSEACLKWLSGSNFVLPVMKAMKRRRDLVDVACETLNNAFHQSTDDLMQQALEAHLVGYLLELLDGSSPAVKAQIVQVLKAMCHSLQHGEQISQQLEKSEIWAEYKDQKHDLFIHDSQTSGYLTSGTPSVAGYLTQGSMKAMSNVPPPMDDN